MSRRVLRTHVDDHGLVFGGLILAIAGSVGDDVFDAWVDRGCAGNLFNVVYGSH